MKKKITLHLIQLATCGGKPLRTMKNFQARLKGLAVKPNDILVFPELWASGFSMEGRDRLIRENALCLAWLQEYARQARCYLVGSMLEVDKGRAYNQAYLLDPRGRSLATYRKIHLFEYGGEHRYFRPGKKVVASLSPWGKLGLAVCYDLRFPELFRSLSKQEARLVFVPSAWPRERLDHFLTLLKARAIENQCFMVGLNKVGPGLHEKPVIYGGHSAVFGPWGEKLAEMGAGAGILSLSLDLSEVERIRGRYPFLKSRILG